MGMPQRTLRVRLLIWDAERPGLHSHAERGNDQYDQSGASSRIRCNTAFKPLLRDGDNCRDSPN
ncbi:hypothetical protein AWU82_29535 [Pseudomonas glycinae]|uniref:Uncharacterized protein n=1 Tax=Pseudomonas glycinae TaxID=1785145 RepID=A0ABM6QI22_9PSED|nr:hypothetical protein AWU82_29535 [Pseudomonas glycinae]